MEMQTLTLAQAQTLIKDRRGLHTACLINNFRVPEFKSSLCTKDYLLKVKDGKVYTPRLNKVVGAHCVNRPPVKDLHEMLCAVIEANFGNMDEGMRPAFIELRRMLEKGKADAKWYCDIISTLTNGTHQIFSRDYLQPKKTKPWEKDMEVSNTCGFFDGLPVGDTKKKGSKTPKRICEF